MTQSTSSGARTLAGLSGTIVLVGAGKMGGALLEGWLALGLDPKSVVVVEPQPAREVSTLASRGLRLNPGAHTVGEASATPGPTAISANNTCRIDAFADIPPPGKMGKRQIQGEKERKSRGFQTASSLRSAETNLHRTGANCAN